MKVTIELELEVGVIRNTSDNAPCVEDIVLNMTKDDLEKMVLDAIWDQCGDDISEREWESAA